MPIRWLSDGFKYFPDRYQKRLWNRYFNTVLNHIPSLGFMNDFATTRKSSGKGNMIAGLWIWKECYNQSPSTPLYMFAVENQISVLYVWVLPGSDNIYEINWTQTAQARPLKRKFERLNNIRQIRPRKHVGNSGSYPRVATGSRA